MVDFAKLVLELDTSDLEQGEAKLKNLTVAGDKAEKSAKKLGSSAKASAAQLKQATKQVEKFGNGLKISGGHTANLTAQLNDIGVMLAAGQNPLQLAMQQGTQINQVFGQMGGHKNAIKGLGVAFKSMVSPINLATLGVIAFSAMGVQALQKIIPKAKTLEERLEELNDVLSSFQTHGALAVMTADQLAAKFGAAAEPVADLAAYLREVQKQKGLKKVADDLKAVATSFGKLELNKSQQNDTAGARAMRLSLGAGVDFAYRLKKFEENIHATREETEKLMNALIALRDASGFEAQAQAAAGLQSAVEDVYSTHVPKKFQEALETINTLLKTGGELTAKPVTKFEQLLDLEKARESSLADQTSLAELLLKYRKGSVELGEKQEEVEKAIFEKRMKSLKIEGGYLTKMLAAWDAANKQKQALEGVNAQLKSAEEKARAFASVLASAADYTSGVQNKISVLEAEIQALESGGDAAAAKIAGRLKDQKLAAEDAFKAQLAANIPLEAAQALYKDRLKQDEKLNLLLAQKQTLLDALKTGSTGLTGALSEEEKAARRIQLSYIKTIQPLRYYNSELQRLEAHLKTGRINQDQFNFAVSKLREEIGANIPMLQEFSDFIGDTVVTGQADFERLADSFKSMLSKMASDAAKQQIMMRLGFGNSVGAAAGGAAGSGAAGSGAAAGGGAIGGAMGGLSGGFKAAFSQSFGAGGSLGNLFKVGQAATAAGGGVMAAVGAALVPLAAVAVAVSFFSTKTKTLDTGLRLTATGADLAAENFKKLEKTSFWGLSKKKTTHLSKLNSDMTSDLQKTYADIHKNVVALSADLGISASALSGFSHQLTFSLKGLSEEQKQTKISEEFVKLGDALSATALGAGSTLNELTDLRNALVTANSSFDQLGLTLFNVSKSGAAAAQTLINQFNGLDGFSESTSFYFENFYSSAERVEVQTKSLNEQMKLLGVSSIPKTRAAFRSLVDAFNEIGDLNGVTSLLKIAPLFADIETAYRAHLDGLEGTAKEKLENAQKAVQEAYDEAVKSIDAEKQAVVDHWNDMLDQVADATQKAADDLEKRYQNVSRIFDTLGDGFAKLLDVAGNRVAASQSALDRLTEALSSRSGLKSVGMQRAQALQIVRSGDRDQLSNALSVLGQDSKGSHRDQLSWARSYAQETTAIKALHEETQGQLSIEEQALKQLEEQQERLEHVRDLLKEQIDIANGHSVSLSNAITAIWSANSDSARKVGDLLDKLSEMTADRFGSLIDQVSAGDLKAHAELKNLVGNFSGLSVEQNTRFNRLLSGINSSDALTRSSWLKSFSEFISSNSQVRDRIISLNNLTEIKLSDLIKRAQQGDFKAHVELKNILSKVQSAGASNDANLSNLLASTNWVGELTDYVNNGISTLTTAQEQESITKAAAAEQISSADKKHSDQISALRDAVEGILKLDKSILSVPVAVSHLSKSIAALANAQAEEARRQEELLAAQRAAEAARLKEIQEQQRRVKLESLEKQLGSQNSAQGVAPELLKIISRVEKGGNWLFDYASYVRLNDGRTFSSKSGSGYEEVRNAERAAQVHIDQRKREYDAWLKRKNAALDPLRNQIRALGGIPKFAGGGVHHGGVRLVGEEGPELEITGPSVVRSHSETKTMLDNRELVKELKELRRELAEFKQEQRQLGLRANRDRSRIRKNSDKNEFIPQRVLIVEGKDE